MGQGDHFRSANIITFSFLSLVKQFIIFQYFSSQIKLQMQTKIFWNVGEHAFRFMGRKGAVLPTRQKLDRHFHSFSIR